MIFIPGFLISLVTFPGVIVHEVAHKFFADVCKVPVHKVCYFRVGTTAGYVLHEVPKTLRASFLISFGPLIINTVLCILFTFPIGFLGYLEIQDIDVVFPVLCWIGLSIGMHALPSSGDIESFADNIRKARLQRKQQGKWMGLIILAAIVFSFALAIANALRFFWFDLFYAIAISIAFPLIVLYFFGL